MNAIQIISQDLFDKVRSRFSNLEMGDQTGAVTIDPAEAKFFDFDFVLEGNNLGRVSISLNDLGTLKVYYSQGITENQDDPAKQEWFKFLREMRLFAMRRLLRFDTRDIAKTNLDKNDFQHLAATQAPKEEEMNTMNESRWSQKSSSKTSRAVAGRTEVIVRHAKPVDEEYAGSRSQKKNIKAIFIQNQDGERFKYPFIHPAGAFAMAQHVDHGGVPHDPAGKAIIRMSEQIAQLQEFQRKVHTATLHDDATGITERALGRLQELKGTVAALGKRHHYENWAGSYQEDPMGDDGMSMDDVTMEQYKQKFTQTNFQEELAAYFPLLHRIMSETNTVDLEDYVGEELKGDQEELDADDDGDIQADDLADLRANKKEKSAAESIDYFVEWAEAIEQGKLTSDQIELLKNAIATQKESGEPLQLGSNGSTAWDFFTGAVGEGPELDDDLQHKLQVAAQEFPDTDAMQVFQTWAQEAYPELAVALGMSGEVGQAEPAPEVGAGTDTGDDQSTKENDEQGGPANTMMSKEGMIKEVAMLVKSRFNKDNPEVGPFNGAPNIALDVKKSIAEKFGDQAGEHAEQMALEFMEKLSHKWEQEHGQVANSKGGDGLARLKELLGNVKAKVEGMGDMGAPGSNMMPSENKDEGDKDWHPSKHVTDPQKKKELAPHDKDVERGSYKDRADYLDKAGVPKSESAEMESILRLINYKK